MNNVLVINIKNKENDPDIEEFLTEQNYTVKSVNYDTLGIDKIINKVQTNNYDFIIIKNKNDNNKESLSNSVEAEICGELREKNVKVIIILINKKNIIEYKVKCFDKGADDYITTPYDKRELYARMKAMERRFKINGEISQIDDLILDPTTRIVKRAGKVIDLTAREYALLYYLMDNKGKKLSRADISHNVWGIDFDTGTNVIDVYIKYLREKLHVSKNSKQLIHTVYGYGYLMELKTEAINK